MRPHLRALLLLLLPTAALLGCGQQRTAIPAESTSSSSTSGSTGSTGSPPSQPATPSTPSGPINVTPGIVSVSIPFVPGVDPCLQFAEAPIPPADLPSLVDATAAGKGCSSLNLYYASTANHLVQARACAFARQGLFSDGSPNVRDTARLRALDATGQDPSEVDLSGDFLTLAMLYSNGQNVATSKPLTSRFTCATGDFTDTFVLLHQADIGQPLQICNAEGSSYGSRPNFQCLLVKQSQLSDSLDKQATAAAAVLPRTQRPAFFQLENAWSTFRSQHQAEEPHTALVQPIMDEELALDQRWLESLQIISAGQTPLSATVHLAPFPELEAARASLLQARTRAAGVCTPADAAAQNCASSAQLLAADRAWVLYRESWVTFAALRWPAIPADQWRAWLTDQRNRQFETKQLIPRA